MRYPRYPVQFSLLADPLDSLDPNLYKNVYIFFTTLRTLNPVTHICKPPFVLITTKFGSAKGSHTVFIWLLFGHFYPKRLKKGDRIRNFELGVPRPNHWLFLLLLWCIFPYPLQHVYIYIYIYSTTNSSTVYENVLSAHSTNICLLYYNHMFFWMKFVILILEMLFGTFQIHKYARDVVKTELQLIWKQQL